ncbi:MAG TPA: hypothetical protein PKI62_08715 [bacterium]|nr:hypothetical protein [bacterium]HPR87468.1 hypothetical protein [bacterium]
MLFRLIVLAILFYVAIKVFGLLFSGGTKEQDAQVRGASQTNPLDLSGKDVEDVEYKELPRNK